MMITRSKPLLLTQLMHDNFVASSNDNIVRELWLCEIISQYINKTQNLIQQIKTVESLSSMMVTQYR